MIFFNVFMAFHKLKKNKNWIIINKLTSLFMIARSGKKTPKNAGEKKKKMATTSELVFSSKHVAFLFKCYLIISKNNGFVMAFFCLTLL